jgi:hypothetical protein
MFAGFVVLVWTQAGPADLVPMRPPRPGRSWLHHGTIGQLPVLQIQLRDLCPRGWLLVAAATSHEIGQVQRALETEFRLNDPGTPRSFLGIQCGSQADGAVSIHQHQYVQKVLFNFAMETCQATTTPMNPKQVLSRRPDEEPSDEETKARFAPRFTDVSGRSTTGYCVCTGHVESLHVSAAIAPLGRPTTIASLYQSHTIPPYHLPQWSIDWIHGCPLWWVRRH